MKRRGTFLTLLSFVVLTTNVWGQGLSTARPETTVAFMTADHLGPMKIVPLGGVGTGYGFGLGFAVRTTAGIAGVSGAVGEHRWGGAAGTAFWVDPTEEMITVLMLQGAPGPARGYTGTLFRQMVRQAIIE